MLDEVCSIITSTAESPFKLLTNYYKGCDTNPPLYFLILHFWRKLFDNNIFFLRLLSTLFVAIGIFFILKIEFLNNSDRLAIFSSFFISTFISFYLIKEIRPYSLQFCLGSIAFYLFSLTKKNNKHYLLLTLINTLLLYVHYYSIFYVGSMIAIELFYLIKQRKYLKGILNLLPFAFFLPWIPAIFNQYKIVFGKFWYQKLTSSAFYQFFLFFYAYEIFFLILLGVIFFIFFKKKRLLFLDYLEQIHYIKKTIALSLSWFLIPFIAIGFLLLTDLNIPYLPRYFSLTFIPLSLFLAYVIKYANNLQKNIIFLCSFFVIYFGVNEAKRFNEKFFEIIKGNIILMENYELVFENPFWFYPTYFYSNFNTSTKKKAYYIMDYEIALNNKDVPNDLPDYFGNKNFKKYFEITGLEEWADFKERADSFIVFNETNRYLLEKRISKDSNFSVSFYKPGFFLVKKLKHNNTTY